MRIIGENAEGQNERFGAFDSCLYALDYWK